MDDVEITYLAAAVGGLLSAFGPCLLPLVLPYLGWLNGAVVGVEGPPVDRRRGLVTVLALVLGFVVAFVTMGASASLVGRLVAEHHRVASLVAGGLLVALGLHVAGIVSFGFLNRTALLPVRSGAPRLLAAFVVGIAFAFGWSPCTGPILATILTLAAARDSIEYGASLLAVYGLAMAPPFLLAGAFAAHFGRLARASARLIPVMRWSSAALIVATGVGLTDDGNFLAIGILATPRLPLLGGVELRCHIRCQVLFSGGTGHERRSSKTETGSKPGRTAAHRSRSPRSRARRTTRFSGPAGSRCSRPRPVTAALGRKCELKSKRD